MFPTNASASFSSIFLPFRKAASASSFAILALAAFLSLPGSAQAIVQTEFATGSFTWDSGVTAAWSTTTGGPYTSTWSNGADAVFEGGAGAVSIDPTGVTAHNLTFNTTGFTVQNNTLTLTGSTPTISIASGSATISSIIDGTTGLSKTGAGTLTIPTGSTYSGNTSVTAGTLILSGNVTLANSLSITVDNATIKPSATTSDVKIGTTSSVQSFTIQNAGQMNNFTGLYIGTTATSNGNSVTFTGAGTAVANVNNTNANKNLHVGDAGSNNTLTVSAGASLSLPKGNGTNDQTIGVVSNANSNTFMITDNGSSYTTTAPLQVGLGGNSNQLKVLAGGAATAQRLLIGAGAGNSNSVLIDGSGSTFTVNSTSNSLFESGSTGTATGNTMTISGSGVFNFTATGNSRDFAIGRASNSNSFLITGTGSALNVTWGQQGANSNTIPVSIGGFVSGQGTVTDGGSGNHLDISSNGAMTSSTSLYVMGTSSAFNLGDGTGVSTATVGATANIGTNSSAFASGVFLKNATDALNFNSGRLIAGANGALVSGLGQVQLNGPAFISTAQAASTISTVIGDGTGTNHNVTKEDVGSLTLSAANTYTGNTIVTKGTLNVTGSLAADDSANLKINTSVIDPTSFANADVPSLLQSVYIATPSYANRGSQINADLNTRADLLAGSNSGAYTANATANLQMQWRQRNASESTAPTSPPLPNAASPLVSDVLKLSGMSSSPSEAQTDAFALQMTYDSVQAAGKAPYLAWLDPSDSTWKNAIAGDFGNNATPAEQNFSGSFATFQTAVADTNLNDYIGAWGVDAANNDVWAVVNHNSQFAVDATLAAVPEPSSLVLGLFGLAGIVAYAGRRRMRRAAMIVN